MKVVQMVAMGRVMVGACTGEDITEYTLTSWTLSPGAGGECALSYYGALGGGGGGVLVNGSGPDTSSYTGQGFGGGGNGHGNFAQGLPGVILLEIVPARP